MKVDSSGGIKTTILGELPIIGGYFRGHGWRNKFSLVGQSVIEFTAGAVAMTFLPMPEELSEDKLTKSTTAILLGWFAGMTYQTVHKGGSELFYCLLRQKAHYSNKSGKDDLGDRFAANSKSVSDDDEEDAPQEETVSKCSHALHAINKFVCEMTPAIGVTAAAMLIPMSDKPEDKFSQSAAVIALGMFGKSVGGVAYNLASGASCHSRQKRTNQISLQPHGLEPHDWEEDTHEPSNECVSNARGSEFASQSDYPPNRDSTSSYDESLYGVSPHLLSL